MLLVDEDDRISGISHVIEHMFFKGTAKRPVGDIARETHALGGYLNAYTYYDRTVYHTEVPAENMKKAFEIQADALWNSTYDSQELKREIEVVLQENNWTTSGSTFAIGPMPTSAARNAAEHAHKKHNARLDDTSISPFTFMSRYDNAHGS